MASQIILPGDSIEKDKVTGQLILGPEIYKNPKTHEVIPSSAGYLNVKSNSQRNSTLVFIESNSKRYIPKLNDYVIGIVSGVYGESYRVLLQDFSSDVFLSMMAFPNASKKNRPNLKIGQAVYARVSQAIPDIDAELDLTDPITGKEGGFGVLDDSGYIFNVDLNYARELLFNPESSILQKLSNKCKFEIAIGINGKVWIKCEEGFMPSSRSKDDIEEDDSTSIRNLKLTLAAYKYLSSCQGSSPTRFDSILKDAFKNIN